jgi:hypothetical protein
LEETFRRKNIYKKGIAYKPPLNKNILIKEKKLKKKNKLKKIIVVISSNTRDYELFFAKEFFLALRESDNDYWREWEFSVLEKDSDGNKSFSTEELKYFSSFNFDEYVDEISSSMIALVPNFSFTPNLSVLEMASAGMVVLTNTFGEVDISSSHSNIFNVGEFDLKNYISSLEWIVCNKENLDVSPNIDWFFGGNSNETEVFYYLNNNVEMMLK